MRIAAPEATHPDRVRFDCLLEHRGIEILGDEAFAPQRAAQAVGVNGSVFADQ
jgi:hypothetical protein